MSSTLEQGYHAIENRPTQEVVNNHSDSGVDASYNPKSLKQVHHIKQIEKLKNDDDTKVDYKWITLPQSVNGTLIYFLIVENNGPIFKPLQFLEGLFYVGFPVYFTFYTQALLLITLWANIPAFATDIDICGTSPLVQQAVVMVFVVFLLPSVRAVFEEGLVCLRCSKVVFPDEDPKRKVLYSLVNPTQKCILTFLLIVVPETLILMGLFYVGTGFILTSGDIGDIICNSVAITFIMDIDNFAREAFESEAVSERANDAEFQCRWPSKDEEFTDGKIVTLSTKVLDTFSNIGKVIFCILASYITMAGIRTTYCVDFYGPSKVPCIDD